MTKCGSLPGFVVLELINRPKGVALGDLFHSSFSAPMYRQMNTLDLAGVREILANDVRVAAAYLHGSAARGADRTESDLDIAILPVPGVRISADAIGDLAAELSRSARRDVDLGLLATSNLIFCREVCVHGCVLVENDRAFSNLFFATVLGEYARFREDRAPVEASYVA